MAVRDRLRKGAAQYLKPGEQIQAVFYAKQPTMQYNDRAVVATDCRLLLLKLNFFGRAEGLVGEAPRETRLGPCSGFMHPIEAFGTRLAINRRFFKDVAEADRLRCEAEGPAPSIGASSLVVNQPPGSNSSASWTPMAGQDGSAAAVVVGERIPRWFATVVTVYFGFLAVFVPLREFPSWVKHAPGSAVDVYLVIVAVALIFGCYRGWRTVLRLDGDGVTVRNYFRTYRIGWSEVKCFTDGNAGIQISGGFAWALCVVTHDRRPVVAGATARYSGARPANLTAIGQSAELHGIAADLAGVAHKVRPRRRNFVGDLVLWLGIMLAAWYPISLLAAASHCTTC